MSARAFRLDDRPKRGAVVGGRFRVLSLRGEGGMGSVYEAEDPVIGRNVALKLLRAPNEIAIERFEREARAASRISSRHVAAVHDFGCDPEHGFYMVMELLEGETLDRVIETQAPLDPSRAAAIGAEIAEALYAAHRADVVHRDLKPSNVLVLAEGGLKVLDFGIARLVAAEPSEPDTTAPDTIVGTPRYMSPESVRGSRVGPAADLYALGIVLFELVIGRAPFDDAVPAVLLTKHLNETPPRIDELRPALPAGLADLVAQLLLKDPEDRPESARRVAEALRSMSDGDGPVRVASGIHATPSRGLRRRVKRRSWLLGGALSALFVAAATLGVVLALREPPPPITSAPLPREPVPDPAPAPPIAEPEPPAHMEIAVVTDPPNALLHLDGVEVSSPIRLPRDGREHELTVRAAGYASARRSVVADRDRTLEIVLRRTPARDRRLPVKLRGW